jgi:hypothetical protein
MKGRTYCLLRFTKTDFFFNNLFFLQKWQEQITFNEMMNDVRFVLDQQGQFFSLWFDPIRA